ncbi:MAG: GNAT family N-acetyltransferase, partial [Balneolaceae bacterium]|nr:GNAT family N-acetyltransferase [Balneolaceae bacterium]
ERWIKEKQDNFKNRDEITWAICSRTGGHLMGAVGLSLSSRNDSAELGYWMGKPYWGRGFTTEASREVLEYAFGELKLNRVEAHHMSGNDASGRVLEKLGLQYEGLHRQRIKKWDEYKDVKCFAILRSDRS